MINIVINNEALGVPCCWEELELRKALALREYLCGFDGFIEVVENQDDTWMFLERSLASGLLSCENLVRAIAHESTSSDSVEGLSFDDKWLWENVLKPFVRGLFFQSDYCLKHITSFKFGDKDYYLPRFHGLSQFVENEGVSAEKFCALNNLYAQNALENAALMCAILASDEGDFNELARSFSSLTMDVVFEVFFIVSSQNIYLKHLFPDCYMALGLSGIALLETQGWHELIYFVAGELPSEIQIAKAMNCLEFMRLLDYKLKKIRL